MRVTVDQARTPFGCATFESPRGYFTAREIPEGNRLEVFIYEFALTGKHSSAFSVAQA
jgi:hypothetical protein